MRRTRDAPTAERLTRGIVTGRPGEKQPCVHVGDFKDALRRVACEQGPRHLPAPGRDWAAVPDGPRPGRSIGVLRGHVSTAYRRGRSLLTRVLLLTLPQKTPNITNGIAPLKQYVGSRRNVAHPKFLEYMALRFRRDRLLVHVQDRMCVAVWLDSGAVPGPPLATRMPGPETPCTPPALTHSRAKPGAFGRWRRSPAPTHSSADSPA